MKMSGREHELAAIPIGDEVWLTVFNVNWPPERDIIITANYMYREDDGRLIVNFPPSTVGRIRVHEHSRPCIVTIDFQLPEMGLIVTALQKTYGIPDATPTLTETHAQTRRPHERKRGIKIGTDARVREMHARLKAGESYRQAEKNSHCTTDTYRRHCLTVTGEAPQEPYR